MALKASDLSVIIPTRDRWSILARTLDALRAQTQIGFETVVVVDGEDSPPPPLDGVRVRVHRKGGAGSARNEGVALSERPLILFLGDDMIPTPDLVGRHLAGHARHPEPESAVLGLSLWHPDVKRNGVIRWMEWSSVQFDYNSIEGEDAGWGRFYSSNVSLKRDFFLDVGGFDEDFEYDYEDLDFAYRAHEKGLRLWYQPEALARHLHSYDLAAVVARYGHHARGERLMCDKHPWFSPFFRAKVEWAEATPPVSPVWPVVADRIPARFQRARNLARERTSLWYHQQVAPSFEAAWDGQRDLSELKDYLGADFDIRKLWNHQREVELEMDESGDESSFYRKSEAYLYDLTAFAMWSTKYPYLKQIRGTVPPGSTLLDYGCGIGTDGLRLIERGYRVGFAEFDNPSSKYLRWRIARRGIEAEVYDIDAHVPSGFDLVYALDVIEHVEEPLDFLAQLEDRAGLVAVNLLEPDPSETHLHRPLPIGRILDRATARGLVHYRLYHGRSHLVIYRSHGPGGWSSRIERFTGAGAARLGPMAARARRALIA